MPAAILSRINAKLEGRLPEKRVFLRSDEGVRYFRLTPLTQIGLAASALALVGWGIWSAAVLSISAIDASGLREQIARQKSLYEARLSELEAERDRFAAEAASARNRFRTALAQLSAQQTALIEAEDRRYELEKGLDAVHQLLRKAVRARDEARARLASLEAADRARDDKALAARLDEARGALVILSDNLDLVARERDGALVAAASATSRAEELRHRIRLLREKNRRIFSRLEDALTVSVLPIRKMFEKAGIPAEKLIEDVRRGYSGLGGPLGPVVASSKGAIDDPDMRRAERILAEIDKVNLYRIAATAVPLGLPVRRAFRVTSRYGMRKHPVSGKRRMHEGIDMAAPYGTPVVATGDGIVTYAGWMTGYGKVVEIRHALGYRTRYAHLSRIRVKKGQRVSRGERIGDMGSTGRSTGSHVHYEVRAGKRPTNPSKYIRAAEDVF